MELLAIDLWLSWQRWNHKSLLIVISALSLKFSKSADMPWLIQEEKLLCNKIDGTLTVSLNWIDHIVLRQSKLADFQMHLLLNETTPTDHSHAISGGVNLWGKHRKIKFPLLSQLCHLSTFILDNNILPVTDLALKSKIHRHAW